MNKIKLLLALMALALPTMAKAERIPTYVSIATWTVGGTGTKAFAFQNTSASRDVAVLRINISPISNGTVTSGPMNFWVIPSTVITHGGTSQVGSSSFIIPNWTQPSFISASTGPVNVQYEGKSTGLSQLPLAVIGVNPDETSTPVLNDLYNGLQIDGADEEYGILLQKGQNRGIVLEQKQFGATDWTAGAVLIKIEYSIR